MFTFILNARLKPEAKKPPNGPITLLKTDRASECIMKGYTEMVSGKPNCKNNYACIFHNYSIIKYLPRTRFQLKRMANCS